MHAFSGLTVWIRQSTWRAVYRAFTLAMIPPSITGIRWL
jgi:hypothetical protein